MFKRQHYVLEHSARDSVSSDSSSLDTDSDGDSGSAEEVDDAAWPASSHESGESSDEEEVVEVESSTSVAARRAEAIRIAERKIAEAAEDVGEFEDELNKVGEVADCTERSCDEAEVLDAEGLPETRQAKQRNGTLALEAHPDCESDDDELEEDLVAQRNVSSQWAEAVEEDELEREIDRFEGNTVICVGGENRVFKCRVCPKIMCLKEETMQVHLASKRHSRSVKQLAEGRLKIQLDSDGEEDEDGETHAERYARTVAAAEEPTARAKKRKRASGRQRQRSRLKAKKKGLEDCGTVFPRITGENRSERRAHVRGGLTDVKTGEAKSRIKKLTRKEEKRTSRSVAKRNLNGKNKRPRQT